MILRRLGNKQAIAQDIIKYFPKHDIYIEMFFGAGGIFFNKPIARYNYLNDIDNDVYNCFEVLLYKRNKLKKYIEFMPICKSILEFAKNKIPDNEIEKAFFFLILSNFTFGGFGDSICFNTSNSKDRLLENIEKSYLFLVKSNNKFLNLDFRKVLNNIAFRHKDNDLARSFCYCDPPYLNTGNNYSDSFNENDFIDLLNCLIDKKIRFAISEFDNEFIINQAKERGLNVIVIGERRNIKNRRTEILITNYENNQPKLF